MRGSSRIGWRAALLLALCSLALPAAAGARLADGTADVGVTATVCFGSRKGNVQVTVWPFVLQPTPVGGVIVPSVARAEIVAISLTMLARSGPLFTTVYAKVTFWPMKTFAAEMVAVTPTSAVPSAGRAPAAAGNTRLQSASSSAARPPIRELPLTRLQDSRTRSQADPV